MTGDRLLKEHEMRVFMQHGSIGLNTVKELLFTDSEPTLFEVAFLELIAKVDAHTNILVEQGARIVARDEMLKVVDRLEMAIKMLNARLNESDESLEEVKKLMTDQIAELRKILWEMEHDYCPKCRTKLEEDSEDSSEGYCPKCNYGWRFPR